MFEKIFGIFRKKKKDDFSAEIPGDTDEEMFDLGDSEMEDDFDADTISLETGMSDGDFSGSSGGGMAESDPEFGDSLGDLESPGDDVGIGMLDLEEDSAQGIGGLEEPVTPPPEVEPMEEEPFAVPAPKRSKKGLLVTVGIVVVGLLVGFLLSSPASIEAIKRATSSEPTIQEQLGALTAENADLKKKLEVYRSVGTMEEILATKAEIKKREEISGHLPTQPGQAGSDNSAGHVCQCREIAQADRGAQQLLDLFHSDASRSDRRGRGEIGRAEGPARQRESQGCGGRRHDESRHSAGSGADGIRGTFFALI